MKGPEYIPNTSWDPVYIYSLRAGPAARASSQLTPPPPPPECGLNWVYLAAGCVCVGRTPRASCQIDPIWCSSVSGPRELNNLNPRASPYLNYLIGAGN